ncbi:MAG: hypothetical protein EOP48_23785 [Sphingobacteriales bacterium]|nr:MAG: hypothetical protein EOP48_23785 [Sphingobacteriales bacterium]
MYTEARKLHLIEEMIKLKSEKALMQIESILKSYSMNKAGRPSAHEFIGKISKKDITLMENAIEEGCEQINQDDWK